MTLEYDPNDPRLLKLIGTDILSMSEEEALQHISDIREDRKITKLPPIKQRRIINEKAKKVTSASKLIGSLNAADKKKLLASLKDVK